MCLEKRKFYFRIFSRAVLSFQHGMWGSPGVPWPRGVERAHNAVWTGAPGMLPTPRVQNPQPHGALPAPLHPPPQQRWATVAGWVVGSAAGSAAAADRNGRATMPIAAAAVLPPPSGPQPTGAAMVVNSPSLLPRGPPRSQASWPRAQTQPRIGNQAYQPAPSFPDPRRSVNAPTAARSAFARMDPPGFGARPTQPAMPMADPLPPPRGLPPPPRSHAGNSAPTRPLQYGNPRASTHHGSSGTWDGGQGPTKAAAAAPDVFAIAGMLRQDKPNVLAIESAIASMLRRPRQETPLASGPDDGLLDGRRPRAAGAPDQISSGAVERPERPERQPPPPRSSQTTRSSRRWSQPTEVVYNKTGGRTNAQPMPPAQPAQPQLLASMQRGQPHAERTRPEDALSERPSKMLRPTEMPPTTPTAAATRSETAVPGRKASAALADWYSTTDRFQKEVYTLPQPDGKGPTTPVKPTPAAGSMLALLKSKGVHPVASAAKSGGEVAGNTPLLSKTAAKDKPTDTSGVASSADTVDAATTTAEHGSSNAKAHGPGTFKQAIDPSGRLYYWDV